ncbi:MAG: ArsA-related P-loop ATPase [Actinomycetota bacterium]
MDPATFFAASRVLIVAGKGGVGKTTVSAALARAASLEGRSALIVEVEGKAGLPAMFGTVDLGYDEDVLVPGDEERGIGEVRARTLTADEALLEYLRDNRMNRVAKRLVSTGVLDVLATAAPGIRDILILGKVKQLERDEVADLIVLDAPAAGHAITFLRAAQALQDSVRVGPINSQAKDVLELLHDPARCQVMLVTLPEETPVNELVETAFSLEEEVGVALSPVVVNGLYPARHGIDTEVAAAAKAVDVSVEPAVAEALDAAADFRRHRMALQAEQLDRLADKLPLPRLELPFLFTADLDAEDIDGLAHRLVAGITALAEPRPDAAADASPSDEADS